MGPFWKRLEGLLGRLGGYLGHLGGILGAIMGHLRPYWGPHGNMMRHLGRLGPSWRPSWAEKAMGYDAVLRKIAQVKAPGAEAERLLGLFLKETDRILNSARRTTLG